MVKSNRDIIIHLMGSGTWYYYNYYHNIYYRLTENDRREFDKEFRIETIDYQSIVAVCQAQTFCDKLERSLRKRVLRLKQQLYGQKSHEITASEILYMVRALAVVLIRNPDVYYKAENKYYDDTALFYNMVKNSSMSEKIMQKLHMQAKNIGFFGQDKRLDCKIQKMDRFLNDLTGGFENLILELKSIDLECQLKLFDLSRNIDVSESVLALYLVNMINNAEQLKRLLAVLLVDCKEMIIKLLPQEKLQSLIKTLNDFVDVMQELDSDHRKQVIEQIDPEYLKGMFDGASMELL